METAASSVGSERARADRVTTDKERLTAELADSQAALGAAHRAQLEVIAECERTEAWRADGCRDLAQWLSARLGITVWAARRRIRAARALPALPSIAAALAQGVLGIDKAVELCRFATPESEARLIPWAARVTVAGVRHKGDLEAGRGAAEVAETDNSRYLYWWWYDDGNALGLEGSLAAAEGALVAKALDRLAGRLPTIVADDEADDARPVPGGSLDSRRADALVALASTQLAGDADGARATVVVHAPLEALYGGERGCELENGPVIAAETLRRLACDCRIQLALEDGTGTALGMGRASRRVSASLLRQLHYRDRGCVFPGCEMRSHLYAHHIIFWGRGGPTELDNLALVCGFHHKLVHEHAWMLLLDPAGTPRWFRPDGTLYWPGLIERGPPGSDLLLIAAL